MCCQELLPDSRAFNELRLYGRYRCTPQQFADQLHRIAYAALVVRIVPVTQDDMCEAVILRKTGRTVAAHQRVTIARYDAIRAALDASLPLMPVVQGALPSHSVEHLHASGARLHFGMSVGVGWVCKRNGHPRAIAAVFRAIRAEHPDLRLYGVCYS